MKSKDLPNLLLTQSTPYNIHPKKSFNKHDPPKSLSSPYMTTPIETANKKRKTTEAQKQHFDDGMMQESEDFSNVKSYRKTNPQNNRRSENLKQKRSRVEFVAENHQNSMPLANQSIYENLNQYKLDQRNTYGEQIYYQKNENPPKFLQQPQINQNEPEPFRFIRETNTFEDLDEQESQDQEPQETFSRTKSANNLRALNQVIMAKKTSGYTQKDKPNYQQKIYQMDELEKKAILQHFRVSDLHFLNDQQLLPQNMLAQRLQKNKSLKYTANNSGKTESNHAVFRDTIQYIASIKTNQNSNFHTRNSQSHQISEHSSMSNSPLTNIHEGYKQKYRKYKEKYINMMEVVKQFQMLNETLIKDQREHFRYYEDTIKQLEGLLLVKDTEIQELSHLVSISRVNEKRNSRELCSIEGRQLQSQNKKLKSEVEELSKEIHSLKLNFKTLEESYQINEKSRKTQSKSSQKKSQALKRENQSLSKKIKPLQDMLKTYGQKIKDKQERINKLSEMNSQLQEQIIKLKNKLRLEETYDTQREYRISFAPKISKEQFIQQNCNKNDISANKMSPDNSIIGQNKTHPEIEKYLACIDNQLRLIRSHMTFKKQNQGERESQNQKKQVCNVLNSVDQFEAKESNLDQPQDNTSLNDLIDVVDRLASFRVSMGV